jgi:hypothetical protein
MKLQIQTMTPPSRELINELYERILKNRPKLKGVVLCDIRKDWLNISVLEDVPKNGVAYLEKNGDTIGMVTWTSVVKKPAYPKLFGDANIGEVDVALYSKEKIEHLRNIAR